MLCDIFDIAVYVYLSVRQTSIFSIMIRNIVVVSGKNDNPAILQTRIDPVRLPHGVTIALTSIAYGEILNIHNKNNKIYFTFTGTSDLVPVLLPTTSTTSGRGRNKKLKKIVTNVKVQIPSGTYRTTRSIVRSIITAINEKIKEIFPGQGTRHSLNISGMEISPTFAINLQNIAIHVNRSDSPWDIIGVTEDIIQKSQNLENIDLSVEMKPSFLYASIVENSYINDQKSRNLAVIPLTTSIGYTFYEFKSPVYVPIEVREFSSILLELRDLDGKFVKFNPKSKTVLTLNMKSINRGD